MPNIPPPRKLTLAADGIYHTTRRQPTSQAGCAIIYLDEYIRRRDALMSKLTDLVSQHRRLGDLRFVAAGGAEPCRGSPSSSSTRAPWWALATCRPSRSYPWAPETSSPGSPDGVRGFIAPDGRREAACDRSRGTSRAESLVGVDSWLWRAVPLRLDELGVPIEDVERVASELSRSKLGWHRSSDPGARFNGLQGRRGVGFGRAR